jgi:hypothetical protein
MEPAPRTAERDGTHGRKGVGSCGREERGSNSRTSCRPFPGQVSRWQARHDVAPALRAEETHRRAGFESAQGAGRRPGWRLPVPPRLAAVLSPIRDGHVLRPMRDVGEIRAKGKNHKIPTASLKIAVLLCSPTSFCQRCRAERAFAPDHVPRCWMIC